MFFGGLVLGFSIQLYVTTQETTRPTSGGTLLLWKHRELQLKPLGTNILFFLNFWTGMVEFFPLLVSK